jgi:hypothetical protein
MATPKLVELAVRELRGGDQTTVTLYWRVGTDECVVEATNTRGATSATCTRAEAWAVYNHPFSDQSRLDYPGTPTPRAELRPLRSDEYALLEALRETEIETDA